MVVPSKETEVRCVSPPISEGNSFIIISSSISSSPDSTSTVKFVRGVLGALANTFAAKFWKLIIVATSIASDPDSIDCSANLQRYPGLSGREIEERDVRIMER